MRRKLNQDLEEKTPVWAEIKQANRFWKQTNKQINVGSEKKKINGSNKITVERLTASRKQEKKPEIEDKAKEMLYSDILKEK